MTNTGATGLISRNAPTMNGVSSLYYQRDALTGLYIDPLTNQPSARISMAVQRKINDASERASSQKVDYGNHVLRDGTKNPSMTFEQQGKKFEQDMAAGFYVAPAIGFGALALSAPAALPVAAYGRVAFAGLSARALTTAGAVNTGIGLGVNASFQIAGGNEFSYVDLTVAGATAFATTGATLLPTIYINTLGAYGGSLMQLQNPIPSMAGAGAGTIMGTVASSGLDFISNSKAFGKYTKPVQQTIKSFKPVASSVIQEQVGNTVKDNVEKW